MFMESSFASSESDDAKVTWLISHATQADPSAELADILDDDFSPYSS